MPSCLILRKWVISKEWFITEMSVYRIPSFFPIPFMIRLEMCSEKKMLKMHSNMALQLYIPDAIFFNFHTLYISQVVLVGFFPHALWLWLTLCWLVMALSTKSWKMSFQRDALWGLCLYFHFFLSFFCIFPFFSYWVLGPQLPLGVGVGHCRPSFLSVVSVLDTSLSRTVFSQPLSETHFMCP